MMRWLDPRSARAAQLWLVVLTGVTATVFLTRAFATRFTIQDDARQFLAWMSRLRDPGAMPGDLTADYFQSVSPPLFRLVYALPAAIGVEPMVTARLLVPLLLIASAIAAWRVASAIAPRPVVALITAACVMLVIIHDDAIFSATPRAFFAPLFLLLLDGLLRDRRLQAIVALVALAAIYPAPALVGLTLFGLAMIRWRPWQWPRLERSAIMFAAAAIAVMLALLPLRAGTQRWTPNVSLAEARTMPVFMSPEGRSNLVEDDGRIGWLCSDRVGFVPSVVNCHGAFSRGALIDIALFIVPILLLAGQAIRRLWRGEPADAAGLLFANGFIAAALWWTIATLVAFDLHLPGRYSQRVLALIGALALGRLIGGALTDPLERRPAIAIALLPVLLAGFATPKMRLVTPSDPIAIARIAALPAATRIAGISDLLDNVPALTGRAVLATAETAIPYQLGYFRVASRAMADTAAALATPDRGAFDDFIRGYRIDVIAVDRGLLAGRRLAPRYATLSPAMASPGPHSWVAAHASSCSIYRGPTLFLLDAHCLARPA